jgi:hypothetical protein
MQLDPRFARKYSYCTILKKHSLNSAPATFPQAAQVQKTANKETGISP